MDDLKPTGIVDSEMYAIAMCVEGLEPIKNDPKALSRVLDFIANRYIDNLQRQLARLDAEIKVVNEKLARQKYDETGKVELEGNHGT